MKRSSIVAAVAAVLACAGAASAQFSINMNYTVAPTPSQQAIFNQAAANWEAVITGYAPGISLTGITINVDASPIDGPFNILGYAGPGSLVGQGGFILAQDGSMTFDAADLTWMETNSLLLPVIMHEMGHVLGIGTLWGSNNLLNNGGQYIGAHGLAAYAAEFGQPGATFIPVENDGGPGTAGAHWEETGPVSNISGQTMQYELMTGWIDAPSFMSSMTVQSMRDLGYTVVPTPAAAALLGLGGLVATRRRRA